MSTTLQCRLETYINNLDKHIKRLRTDDKNEIRNLINENDANLIEAIKYDLLEMLKGV